MAPLLYKNEVSPPANAVRMLAEIIGLELQLKDIDFLGLEHKSSEYLKDYSSKSLNFLATLVKGMAAMLIVLVHGQYAAVYSRPTAGQQASSPWEGLWYTGAPCPGVLAQEIISSFPSLTENVICVQYSSIAGFYSTLERKRGGDTCILKPSSQGHHAIMIYLLSKYGGDKAESLYPSDLRTRTTVNQVMFFNTGVYFIRVKEVALPSVFGNLTGPTEQNIQGIEDAYSVLEIYLQNRKYVAADHLTIADLAVVTTTCFLEYIHKLDSNKYPRFSDWLSRMKEESFCKNIVLKNIAVVGEIMNSAWEKNKQK